MLALIPEGPVAQGIDAHKPTVRWVVGIFAASILLQRLALPGGIIPALLLVVFGACAYGLWGGLLTFDSTRLSLYLLAAGLTAFVAIPQSLVLRSPLISLTSWGLFMTVWAPATVRLIHCDRVTLMAAYRGCLRWGVGLTVAAIAMRLVQVLGVAYIDPLPIVVPNGFLVQGYVITYPVEYGSEIYRSNAWIGLEPSIVSLQLGITLVLAVLLRARAVWLLIIGVGMICTLSGSGIFIAVIALAVMLLTPMRRTLWQYVAVGAAGLVIVLQTSAGRELAKRATEAAVAGSSTSLRAIELYRYLWPTWTDGPWNVLLGMGAGSSQKLVDSTNRAGLLVPSPIKVFFDYGVIAGIALAIFLIFCYYGGPSISLAAALFGSAWMLQPGTTTFVIAVQTLIFVTWWAPRRERSLESEPTTRHETEILRGAI